MANFADQLAASVTEKRSPVLVGLDPRLGNLPPQIQNAISAETPQKIAAAYRQFCCEIIDVVASLVPAVKPQAAFFEQQGPAGMAALAAVVEYARKQGLLVILDGKRNDIGSTATAYADGYLGKQSCWQADALTVSPYLGDDSLTPFVDVAVQRDAGIFVLVKTSNPGGGLFQDLKSEGRPLFESVGAHVEHLAKKTQGLCGYGSVGAVVGATYPEQLAALREAMPHTWFLIPGFGSQGGTAKDVAAGFDARGSGAIVNSSRAIIFAYQRPEYQAVATSDWQRAIEAATKDMTGQLTNT